MIFPSLGGFGMDSVYPNVGTFGHRDSSRFIRPSATDGIFGLQEETIRQEFYFEDALTRTG